MGLINLKYRNTSVSLVAEDELRTCELARRFNARIDSLAANNNSNVGDAKLAFIIGLMLEDEIDKLKSKLDETQDTGNLENKATEIVREALDQVSTYLESLAQKIENN